MQNNLASVIFLAAIHELFFNNITQSQKTDRQIEVDNQIGGGLTSSITPDTLPSKLASTIAFVKFACFDKNDKKFDRKCTIIL